MGKNTECQVLCETIKLTADQSKVLVKRIQDAYHVHL
jgi:hypothetical protein